MKQQTAVEWLECELKKIPFINVSEVFIQAKQMEREQIMNAHTEGYSNYDSEMTSVEYYNQTYNQKT